MCGIVGTVSAASTNHPDRQVVEAAVRALRHRGPDESGVWTGNGVALGHTRLSIIDLEHGSQPVMNETGSVVAVYNGEIWNHESLRRELRDHRFKSRADTEVLVHAYEEWGDDFVGHLNGMFAFALWDAEKGRLLLGRDRLGKKPLYFTRTGDGLVFGSDARSVLLVSGVQPALDRDAVAEFLFQRYVSAPRTLFEHIEKLLPGHTLAFDRHDVEIAPYWRIPAEAHHPISPQELRMLLTRAVRERLMSDVPLGVLLSGGIDSTAVLGLMREAGAESIASFTIGFRDALFDERELARVSASRYGTEHHELEVTPVEFVRALPSLAWYRDEPIAEASEVPLYLLAQFAHRHVKVVLSGEGGDELFGGYPKYRAEALLRTGLIPTALAGRALGLAARRRSHRRLDRAVETLTVRDPTLRWRYWFRSFSPPELHHLLHPSLRETARPQTLTEPLARLLDPYPGMDAGRAMLLGDLLTYLPDNMLARGDKVLMAASIEGRMPLLDYRLVARVANVPAASRSGVIGGKRILRRAVADLIPLELRRQPKRGFPVPVAQVLFDGSPDLCNILLSDRCLDRGLFDREELTKLVRQSRVQSRENELKLFTLVSLELWLRTNVDQLRLTPPESLEAVDAVTGDRAGRFVA